jgi:hypothetical protein
MKEFLFQGNTKNLSLIPCSIMATGSDWRERQRVSLKGLYTLL